MNGSKKANIIWFSISWSLRPLSGDSRLFQSISEHYRRFPKTGEHFRRCQKTAEDFQWHV